MKYKLEAFNLAALFSSAFALSTFLHEFAHAVMAMSLHVDSVLFHSYVSTKSELVTANQQILISSAGPVFSAVQAVIFFRLFKQRVQNGLSSWFYLWMSLIGMIVFFGYIIIAPFVSNGDTGRIYAILDVNKTFGYGLSALSMAMIIFLLRKSVYRFRPLLSQFKDNSGVTDQQIVQHYFIVPVLMGLFFNILISLPAPTAVSLVFPIFVSLLMIPAAIRLYRNPLTASSNLVDMSQRVFWPLITFLFLLIVSRILANGIAL